MRLIDADAFSKALGDRVDAINENMRKGATLPNIAWFSGMACAENIVEAQPTIDAVPVIRCKDCKLWMKNPYRESSVFGLCFKHKDIAIATDETDWCSWAERRNDEAD